MSTNDEFIVHEAARIRAYQEAAARRQAEEAAAARRRAQAQSARPSQQPKALGWRQRYRLKREQRRKAAYEELCRTCEQFRRWAILNNVPTQHLGSGFGWEIRSFARHYEEKSEWRDMNAGTGEPSRGVGGLGYSYTVRTYVPDVTIQIKQEGQRYHGDTAAIIVRGKDNVKGVLLQGIAEFVARYPNAPWPPPVDGAPRPSSKRPGRGRNL